DLGQIIALQLILGTERLTKATMGWIGRTGRAQLLWGLAAVITIEIVLIQPWFLLAAVPRFLLGYLDIRARFVAERRARLLAPLRQRDTFVGAISAQSRRVTAYDEGDLQLLAAIANEAAIALERATLHNSTATLSRRLFELHRIGLAISEKTELVDVAKLLAESVVDLLKPAVSAVYIDKGGDTLDFAFTTGKAPSDLLALPKNSPAMSRVLETGQAVAV